MEKQTVFEIMEELNLTLASFKILKTKYTNGKLSKIPNYESEWNSKDKLTFNKTHQAFYVRTGKRNNIVVVDLDNMESEICKNIYEICKKIGTFTVKTRKGYHFYFEYDKDFKKSPQLENFDIRSKKSNVFCPPTIYYNCDTNEKYEYSIVQQDKYVIKKMSEELKNLILPIYREKIAQTKEKTTKKTTTNTKKKTITVNNEDEKNIIMEELLMALPKIYYDDYNEWEKIAYCLHNEGYPFSVFEKFSKQSNKFSNKDEQYYEKLQVRNEDDKKLTTATLWQILINENIDMYKKLKMREMKQFFELEINKNEKFTYSKLHKLIEDDTKDLNKDYYYLFNKSRSFKYFNHFHIYHSSQATIYRIGEDVPMCYQNDMLPNCFVMQQITIKSKRGKMNFTTKDKKHSFINLWKEQKEIHLIDKFVFNPNPKYEKVDEEVNLFTGFKYDVEENDGKYDIHNIEPYLNHIKNLVNNDKISYEYIINWLSWIIQYPHKKTCSALVFYSAVEGVGKNITFDVMQKIFGKYYINIRNQEDFITNFNSHQQNKLIFVCNEINARMREIAGELRNLISRTEMSITYKGKETFTIEDYMNGVFTTNNEQILRIPVGERRFMLIECTEEKLKKESIDKILDIMDNDDKLRQLYNFLKTRDLSKFNPRDVPITEYKKILIMNDMPAYIKMFQMKGAQFSANSYTPQELYLESLTYAKENRLQQNYTDRRCYKDLRKYFGEYLKRTSKSMVYKFPNHFENEINNLLEKKIFNM